MAVKVHGIELVEDSYIENLRVESLSSIPVSLETGRIWFDSTNNYLRGIVNDGASDISRQLVSRKNVDDEITQLPDKGSVRVATVSDTFSGTPFDGSAVPLAIDGITLASGDRILVKDSADASLNGIYVAGTPGVDVPVTRALDFDGTPEGEVITGVHCFVLEGTANERSGWLLTTTGSIDLGTTDLTFALLNKASGLQNGLGILNTADTFSVKLNGSSIEVSAEGMRVEDSVFNDVISEFDDTPVSLGTTGQTLYENATNDGFEWGNVKEYLTDLIDTPAAYQAGSFQTLKVNTAGDGIEWGDPLATKRALLDTAQANAGLETDGTFSALSSNYIDAATSLVSMTTEYDQALADFKTVVNARSYTFESSGAALNHVVTHNLNTNFIDVTLWVHDSVADKWELDQVSVTMDSANQITVPLSSSENIRVVVKSANAISI